ncbi:MAG: CDP-alcohol phosphatidyltransferase family protein [Muribaculaceae bacterium]|nr:CDP-alcohol phosphatidyltransferase family protein [Bacteroidales bacterium]MBD5325339.1 CDP-alcohol phosphatidyltransferase family protein [Bacteroides sp.]MDE6222329.1 CDP-alcohol phosphatidyltransferase family protein [Muribaculaceae bacterium]MBD5326904.1 CDP-alcohol phosphatidyltransferase family protein [Bacteroides sp.]MDE6229806.1 CDP-alcohol phosphatidyltransferase family protein [Muribaculaceae bacterium]
MSNNDFKSTLKSLDTEEHIDIYFYRRIGFAEAKLAEKLGITPNAITIASIFIGVAAGICFYPTNLWVNIAGLLLLILANSFDSADGQLARMTKQYSQLGRILDGMAGDFWFISIYVCICLRTNQTMPWFADHSWVVWTLAVAAGVCHAFQAAMADYYRQMHLQVVNGKSELEDSSALSEKRAQARGLQKIIMSLYVGYTHCQEALTANAQKLRRRGPLPAEFRQKSLPLMKWANVLTFNWRSITIAVTLLLGFPWVYFACELVLGNIILAYMIARHEAACRSLL